MNDFDEALARYGTDVDTLVGLAEQALGKDHPLSWLTWRTSIPRTVLPGLLTEAGYGDVADSLLQASQVREVAEIERPIPRDLAAVTAAAMVRVLGAAERAS